MKFSKTLFAVLALFVVLGLASCQKGDTTIPVTSQNDVAIENFVLYTPDLSVPTDFTESTVESPAALAPPPTDPGTGTGGNTGNVAPLNPITKMLRDLKLTNEQLAKLKRLMVAREDCVRKLMLRLRASEKEIMDKAELARREVMKALKNGDITREEAAARMKAINERTRKALMDNPVRLQVMKLMKDCEDTFLDAVGGILDRDQLAKWNDFVKKYKEMRDRNRPTIGTKP